MSDPAEAVAQMRPAVLPSGKALADATAADLLAAIRARVDRDLHVDHLIGLRRHLRRGNHSTVAAALASGSIPVRLAVENVAGILIRSRLKPRCPIIAQARSAIGRLTEARP